MFSKALTPEELIRQIGNQKLKVSPIIDLTAHNGEAMLLACDCSGCNNPAIIPPIWGIGGCCGPM